METTARKQSQFRFVMLILIMLIYVVTYSYAATSLSALLPTIRQDLGLDLMQASLAVGALPLGIACFTFIAGILLDKVSIRILMFFTIIVCAGSIFMRGSASSYGTLYASMFILGVGQAFVFPGCAKIVATWFTRDVLWKYNGILIAAAPMGMILGYNTSIPLHNAIGWQTLFHGLGILGFVVAIVWVIVARDRKNEDVELNKQVDVDLEKNSIWQNLKAVLAQRQTWMLVFAEAFFNGMIQTVIAFGATVLGTFPDVTPQLAALTSSLGNLGSLVGYFVLPPIAEKFGVRKPFIWTSMVINAILLVIAFMSGNIYVCMVFFFVGFFFNGWSNTGARTMLMESPGIAGMRSGTAMGFMLTMARLAAFVFPVIFAAIAAAVGSEIIGIAVIAGFSVIAAIFILLSKETGMGKEAAQKMIAERKATRLAAKSK